MQWSGLVCGRYVAGVEMGLGWGWDGVGLGLGRGLGGIRMGSGGREFKRVGMGRGGCGVRIVWHVVEDAAGIDQRCA